MTLQGLGRKLLLVLLGLLGCVLLIVALLPYIVSLDRVKDQIVSRIEVALQRKVDVGAVRLQILSGLGAGLEDVTVYNPPGWEQPYVLKAATLSIKVAWWPFLHRRIEITKMILRDGAIVIERDAQGRLNLADATGARPAAAHNSSDGRAALTQQRWGSAWNHSAGWTARRRGDVAEYVDHLHRSPGRSRTVDRHGGQRRAAAATRCGAGHADSHRHDRDHVDRQQPQCPLTWQCRPHPREPGARQRAARAAAPHHRCAPGQARPLSGPDRSARPGTGRGRDQAAGQHGQQSAPHRPSLPG